jgi:hypothetical protein
MSAIALPFSTVERAPAMLVAIVGNSRADINIRHRRCVRVRLSFELAFSGRASDLPMAQCQYGFQVLRFRGIIA